MNEVSLPRTGQPRLEFTGVLLATAKSPAAMKHEQNPNARCHWFESDVYRTKGGKFILAVRYRWAGKLHRESNQDFATVHASADKCLAAINEFDPTECVNGFPEGPVWNEKQAVLMDTLQADFDMLTEQIETQVANATQQAERVD